MTEHGGASASRNRLPVWPAKVLLVSLMMPFFFPVGPLLLTADRIFLIVSLVPCLIFWLNGRAGRIHTTDILLLMLWFWMTLSTLVIEGAAVTIEAGGINLLETMSAYLVGRCFIRDADAFYEVVRFLFRLIVIMLPFALYETITSDNVPLAIANAIWPSYQDVPKDPRWGLDRVALVFAHPILYGVFCGSCFGLTYYVLGYNASSAMRLVKASIVGGVTFLSLSSGPITALAAQIGLISWDRILASVKRRWAILSGGFFFCWVVIELAANRSAPEIFISYFAFDARTAYNRIRIWRYGTMSVAEHPWFGIGRGDWERPYWMSDSMDMFWLVPAVRQGLPAGLLLHAAFFAIVLAVAFKRGLDERAQAYRTGYLVCMAGFYLAGWTVHYWKVIYVLFVFLLGSGAWLLRNQTSYRTPLEPEAEGDESDASFQRPTGPTNHMLPTFRAAPDRFRGSDSRHDNQRYARNTSASDDFRRDHDAER